MNNEKPVAQSMKVKDAALVLGTVFLTLNLALMAAKYFFGFTW